MKKFFYIIILIAGFVSCQKDDLSDLKDVLYVRRNGADMPAYIYGNGESKVFIIILHGGPGGSGLEYRSGGYSDDLEDKYAVVYWDQRGQGMSQGHYDRTSLNLDELVKDVKALALVIKYKYGQDSKLFLLGHSWGGMLGTATLITEDYQNLFNGWIDVDGAHDIPLLYNSAIKEFKTIGYEQIALGNDVDFWNEQIDFVLNVDTGLIDENTFDELNSRAGEAEKKLTESGVLSEAEGSLKSLAIIFQNNFVTAAVAGGYTSNHIFVQNNLSYKSLTPYLDKIKIPTLIMWGRYDLTVPVDLAYSVYDNIGSTVKDTVFFEKSAHSPMMNEPDKFVDAISNFIEQNK